MLRLLLLGAIGLALIALGCSQQYTGPWKLTELKKAPTVQWGETEDGVRSLYYSGLPYNGHPTRIFAYYGSPKNASGPVPGMVLVHGGGGKAFKEWVQLWLERGYAAIAMDLAGCGPDGKRLPDGGPDQGHEMKFNDMAKGYKMAWSYHAVANVVLAHSLIRSFPEVDANRTGVTGISWGGYLTCIVAGLDDRFKVAVPVYGCGFYHEDERWNRCLSRLSSEQRQQWIDYYDPSRYLPQCRMPILFINGTNDQAFPLDIYQKSYRLVRGPRTLCITVKMPHGHPPGWAPREIGLFVDSVLRGGQPLARITSTSRDGQKVTATFDAKVPIKEASLHYTTDSGELIDRNWHTQSAQLGNGFVEATMPGEQTTVYFITLEDERGAIVSTEHEFIIDSNR